jgi:hypothetical protein
MLISFETLLLVSGFSLEVSSYDFFLALKERFRRTGLHRVRYDLMGWLVEMTEV